MSPDVDGGIDKPGWLTPKPVQRLTGEEHFTGSPLTVADFWRWAFSDLRTNIVRGISRGSGGRGPISVTRGVGQLGRNDGDGHQSDQRKLSAIVFSGLTGRAWLADTNERADERSLRAEVYVFAMNICREPDQYDPLRIEDWRFRVMSAAQLAEHGVRSVTLGFLEKHAPDDYGLDDLAQAVEDAHERTYPSEC